MSFLTQTCNTVVGVMFGISVDIQDLYSLDLTYQSKAVFYLFCSVKIIVASLFEICERSPPLNVTTSSRHVKILEYHSPQLDPVTKPENQAAILPTLL